MSIKAELEKVTEHVGAVLNDTSRPLKERFRALFTLRNIGGAAAIASIARCFTDDSVLLKHELAYCLGQMQDERALPVLTDVLSDTRQDPMVRHEAAEALGAIGDSSTREVLKQYLTDPAPEVAETCQLALARLAWLEEAGAGADSRGRYMSVDPAPPAPPAPVTELRATLLDEKASLFDRYRAMFALRDLNTPESIDALGAGLRAGSALFRHEVAFVFGQLQSPLSVRYLRDTLRDATEHEMVRHEAAEALGAVATPECAEILRQYLEDSKRVVRESCEVALDMSEYENSPELQYANTLLQVSV